MTLDWVGPLAVIIWADLLLSGDNAVVIAMACRGLPQSKRLIGMILGCGGAFILRILGIFFATELMMIPGLSILGAFFLLWIAFQLAVGDDEDGEIPKTSSTLMGVMVVVALADASMSLDNVMAVAAIANGKMVLFVVGVLISLPIVIAGSAVLSTLIDRFPVLKWIGVGLLGWVSGAVAIKDALISAQVDLWPSLHYTIPAMTSAILLILAANWHVIRSEFIAED